MSGKKSLDNRTQFQIDRIAFFSDAVIAIAITLLTLEVKIPEFGNNATWVQIKAEYGETLTRQLAALIICFWTIGSLWIRHHELYEYIINIDLKIIKVNLYFLFSIILMPLAVSFLFGNNPLQLKLMVFFTDLFSCNFFYFILLLIVFHSRNNLSSIQSAKKIIRMKTTGLLTAIVFLVVCVLVLLNVEYFYYPLFLLPLYRLYCFGKSIFER
jgi:uncharacterized membrane protein